MRIARLKDRLVILKDRTAVDVHDASDGLFSPDPDAVFPRWSEFRAWADAAAAADQLAGGEPYEDAHLGPLVVRPAQVFAVGLNYRDHAKEAGVEVPLAPTVFTKFSSCLVGPHAQVELPSDGVDWEVELVIVVGARAQDVAEEDAWNHVAGLMVGQDLSERAVQLAGPVPQFSLGKSFPGFGPIGPALVTADELDSPDDLAISCMLDGEVLQTARTSDMLFSVSELVSKISRICPLLAGDLIFTGTPPGVGMARTPQRFLLPGSTLVSEIEGLGQLVNTFTVREKAAS